MAGSPSDRRVPLTPVAFEILLSLADADRHGYAIMQDVDARTRGAVRLRPGTLYRAISRLLALELIEERDERPDPAIDDERRRYYGLTGRGRAAAEVEARRLADQVTVARTRKLLKGARSGS